EPRRVSVQIGKLNEQLLTGLSDHAIDLLEIASLVYAVDALVSRGGTVMRQMGKQWHRRFIVTMSVRDIGTWLQPDLRQWLEDLLFFLSDDRFEFEFVERDHEPGQRERFFRFDADSAWKPDRVLMFSGGLDSFAGALEEIFDHRHKVALVSHFSATKLAPVQRDLATAIRRKLGPEACTHYTIKVHIPGKKVVEGTHRTRSFLFAVLGAIVADLFELKRVSFHENGVVSLNLPPVANVVGARATRTTHPKSLALFSKLVGMVFRQGMRIDNPFFWKTKTEVIETIGRLGFEEHIRNTHSCADVHNRSKQYIHCGRCSQCIDRRFAMLAAGVQGFDPAEAYNIDLMTGERTKATDREIALSYVRNARFFEMATSTSLVKEFPAVVDAISHLGEPAATALKKINGLLQRHGAAVSRVMRRELEADRGFDMPWSTLPRLYAEDEAARLKGLAAEVTPAVSSAAENKVLLAFNKPNRTATIAELVNIRMGATHNLLWALAEKHLGASGRGLDPLDYPATSVQELTEFLGYTEEGNVRQQVKRSRAELSGKFESAGLDTEIGRNVIENVPGHGYRLNPDLVEVRVKQ
ncbi:MAG: 7-cyano-7-deazaguanine synthase, partial [Pseudomonadota bacterium]